MRRTRKKGLMAYININCDMIALNIIGFVALASIVIFIIAK
jgi:hypothetical protein